MNENLKHIMVKSFEKGFRFDGRKLDEYRPIKLEYGVASNAEGSARVKIGDTELIVGVKMAVEAPYPDIPDEGTMMIGAEFLPIANPEFELGPPGRDAIELARVVDRGIRESKAIDTKQLCIEPGEKVWVVMADICTINDSGNLFDAAALATIAAMKDTRFPEYDGEKIDYKKKTDKKLPLSKIPVSVTVCKIGDFLLIDPTTEEQKVIDARLTVAVSDNGKLCALQKGGDAPLTSEDVSRMVDLALKKSEELRKHL